MVQTTALQALQSSLTGELYFDDLHKSIYATDASVYRKIPLAVAFPKEIEDIQKLIEFAQKQQITLIPRTAGTSLAGQCVGEGIVVDVSKYFTQVLGFDEVAKTITVQPGVIRDELNLFLKPYGLFFGPNTSTSNRCMIGGMVGNNSSGSTSIKYGVTRDKVLQIEGLLSDGTPVTFGELTSQEFKTKVLENTLEGKIYRALKNELSQEKIQQDIHTEFPKDSIHRRNTGYAVDELLHSELFGGDQETINVAKLLSGSEGTLVFSTAITLQLDDVQPKESMIVASHFESVNESLKATVLAMKHDLYTCELMDKVILDCTKSNREQAQNRFFIKGDPEAVLMLEVSADTPEETERLADALIEDLKQNNFGYHHPKISGGDIKRLFDLRKAGLGLLGNMIGDPKAVACIEDTAVALNDLPDYIEEFTQMMERHQQKAVYYAHAGAGEIHLRPILNLKKSEDVKLFRTITTETAELVKKYGGSFSGEHGDGIVRAEFIPLMIGEENYQLLRRIKKAFDPNNVFNQGKITDAFPMDKHLRYEVDRNEPEIDTLQDFSDNMGILRLAEKCNGSGDCRKPAAVGGAMCPSYRATKDEKDTTRARANTLREFLTNSEKVNKFDHKELKEVFDLCLSCKACASECPSNVDVAALKAEFLYQYQEENGYSFRSKSFANSTKVNKLASKVPGLYNAFARSPITAPIIKRVMGIHPNRTIPKATKSYTSFYNHAKSLGEDVQKETIKTVYLFVDEFTNYLESEIAVDAEMLLSVLDYKMIPVDHLESGRSYISKGFLKEAKELANENIEFLKTFISKDSPLVGIEPSAILTFRDEYLRLADDKEAAKQIAENTFTIEEFIANEFANGHINANIFTSDAKEIKIHGHCHQKALSSTHATFQILNIPKNYKPVIMNTGCCGMAGSFGYEKEHYEVSMQVGEDTLFPKVRKAPKSTIIAASGTSCRHQILDGTQRVAKHPVTILKEAVSNF
ncbi:FAD-binding and (Fe-S)-binding domain-containing protein [Pseudotenacibaculum haliotis]|uniref:FAD-binding and (Fe-S)-binding domain-containing protein n=1 Tax=Pseudotenacibaculum haliotis TaxID=1862138 RepID=A0ABW5LPD7_9FLAO